MRENEKISYLKALLYISTIDEELDENEKEYLLRIADAYGLSSEEVDDLLKAVLNREESMEEILFEIKDRKVKLLLVYELIALCYADGNYSDKEKSGVLNISRILGIEKEKVDEIQNIMNESVALQNKINIVLERETM